jgi:hypothetical protein
MHGYSDLERFVQQVSHDYRFRYQQHYYYHQQQQYYHHQRQQRYLPKLSELSDKLKLRLLYSIRPRQ